MSNAKHITELLSAYLDGRLSAREREQIEAHLRTCAKCSRDLSSLRYTVTLVKHAPVVRAPRSFTLSDELATRVAPPWRTGWLYTAFQGMTALATILLVVVLGVDFWAGLRFGAGAPAAAPAPAANFESPVAARPSELGPTDQAKATTATSSPAAPPAAAPTAADAPARAVAASPMPTASAEISISGAQRPTAAPTRQAQTAETFQALATATPVPTATATSTAVPPTSTPVPTPAVRPPAPTATPLTPAQPALTESPLRVLEAGLLGLVVLGAAAMLLLRTQR